MANVRTFYACQKVALGAPSGSDGGVTQVFTDLTAVQSVGITSNFNLDPVYQLGSLDPAELYEDIPEVEISLTKAIDENIGIYEAMMGEGTLTALSDKRSAVQLTIFPQDYSAGTGVSLSQCKMEPAYLSSITWNFPADGQFTEEATIVSNTKEWSYNDNEGNNSALSAPVGTGVARRQNFDESSSILPITSGSNVGSGRMPGDAKIQNVSVSVDLGREDIFKLGERLPFTRYINFPVEVTTEFEVISASGDLVGVTNPAAQCANPKALQDLSISLVLCNGLTLDLGDKNKLNSVSAAGGDAGGDNVTYTYSYINYSSLDYTGPAGVGASVGNMEPVNLKSFNLQDYNSKDD